MSPRSISSAAAIAPAAARWPEREARREEDGAALAGASAIAQAVEFEISLSSCSAEVGKRGGCAWGCGTAGACGRCPEERIVDMACADDLARPAAAWGVVPASELAERNILSPREARGGMSPREASSVVAIAASSAAAAAAAAVAIGVDPMCASPVGPDCRFVGTNSRADRRFASPSTVRTHLFPLFDGS